MNNCKHYFVWGYTLEPVIYCNKCDKEIEQLGIDAAILRTHTLVNGKFTLSKNKIKIVNNLFITFFKKNLLYRN